MSWFSPSIFPCQKGKGNITLFSSRSSSTTSVCPDAHHPQTLARLPAPLPNDRGNNMAVWSVGSVSNPALMLSPLCVCVCVHVCLCGFTLRGYNYVFQYRGSQSFTLKTPCLVLVHSAALCVRVCVYMCVCLSSVQGPTCVLMPVHGNFDIICETEQETLNINHLTWGQV